MSREDPKCKCTASESVIVVIIFQSNWHPSPSNTALCGLNIFSTNIHEIVLEKGASSANVVAHLWPGALCMGQGIEKKRFLEYLSNFCFAAKECRTPPDIAME